MIFRYAPEDRAQAGEHYPSLGVSNLLGGNARHAHARGNAADGPSPGVHGQNPEQPEEPQIDVIQLAGYQQQQPAPEPRSGWNRSKAK